MEASRTNSALYWQTKLIEIKHLFDISQPQSYESIRLSHNTCAYQQFVHRHCHGGPGDRDMLLQHNCWFFFIQCTPFDARWTESFGCHFFSSMKWKCLRHKRNKLDSLLKLHNLSNSSHRQHMFRKVTYLTYIWCKERGKLLWWIPPPVLDGRRVKINSSPSVVPNTVPVNFDTTHYRTKQDGYVRSTHFSPLPYEKYLPFVHTHARTRVISSVFAKKMIIFMWLFFVQFYPEYHLTNISVLVLHNNVQQTLALYEIVGCLYFGTSVCHKPPKMLYGYPLFGNLVCGQQHHFIHQPRTHKTAVIKLWTV